MVRVNRFEEDAAPSHPVQVENGCVWVRSAPATARRKKLPPAHSLARPVARQPGGLRVVDISTTVQDPANPRYSTSEAPLEVALHHAREELPCEAPLLKLSELKFRACEGAGATRAQGCTGPCSVTQMDAADQMTPAYDTLVHWVDVVLLAPPCGEARPVRSASKWPSGCTACKIQITLKDRVLSQNKVVSGTITGGPDNVPGVAWQLLGFFSELGGHIPQFPCSAHARGWTA